MLTLSLSPMEIAGWIPKCEDERQKFQELALCLNGSREWIGDEQEGGLETLQARLKESAAEVKATTTATRNNYKFKVPDEIRMMAAAAKCRETF